ncbi:MAG: hypothetical protein KGK06_12335 [Xanthomonadaceae bacterium]|nr:hypothetical protein [Xanthomonadaceae bacterium]
MRLSTRINCLILLSLTAFAVAAPSIARERHDHRFEHKHPRRDQVVDRTQRQNRRITNQVREGELTHAQAHALRTSDRSVAQQQRADAKANGGYITKTQQKALNQELNANSKQIGH